MRRVNCQTLPWGSDSHLQGGSEPRRQAPSLEPRGLGVRWPWLLEGLWRLKAHTPPRGGLPSPQAVFQGDSARRRRVPAQPFLLSCPLAAGDLPAGLSVCQLTYQMETQPVRCLQGLIFLYPSLCFPPFPSLKANTPRMSIWYLQFIRLAILHCFFSPEW